jgi:hypothetical protein
MATDLPRILSPNLGCPFILSHEELNSKGFSLVIAAGGNSPPPHLSLTVRPSYPGEGKEISLKMGGPHELSWATLPERFTSIEETRFFISTTLKTFLFGGQARFFRYEARPAQETGFDVYRKVAQKFCPTLYDLHFEEQDGKPGFVPHALCLRPGSKDLRFIHLTDLHVALRNDLYAANVEENITIPELQDPEKTRFNNFNDNLRRFIAYANSLADEGQLDLVLLTGDLIDFLRHGFQEREDLGRNNFILFRNLILGEGGETHSGLKVPIFTSTGNHDWRFYPYNPEVHYGVYNINREVAQQLDLFWADEQEEISRRGDSFYAKLLREGSSISNKTRFGKLINWGLRYLEKWQVKLLTPVSVAALTGLGDKFPLLGSWVQKIVGPYDNLFWSALSLAGIPVAMEAVTGYIKRFTRKRIFDLMAIEAGWQALKDYFLTINPYFNYAFRAGNHYFLMLDTGHDCVRAQHLWDDGDKKLGPVSIRDNTIGQSPDSMAFYDINEYYPYSQIGWIERVMELIQKEKKEPFRVFVGLHAPPANLSKSEARKALKEAGDKREGILLPEGEYNIRYGTINHYLSHFYHLCLGRTEQRPEEIRHPPVDMVLAGHAHWKLEFRLAWNDRKNGPAVYFGNFTGKSQNLMQDFDGFRPFLFQTPGCGPRESFSPEPPYFRLIEIGEDGKVLSAGVMRLDGQGKAQPGEFVMD